MKFSKARVIGLGLCMALINQSAVRAGTVAGFGGSTEITQILNNIELAGHTIKQAAMVAEEVKANYTALQQYAAALANLKSLPDALRNQTSASYQSQIASLRQLYGVVSGLQSATSDTQSMMQRRVSEMGSLKLAPGDYLDMESQLAARKGGIYAQQMQADLASIDTLQARSDQLRALANTPVTGNIEGLQLLNQQTTMLTGEMMDLKGAVLQQNAIANGERSDQKRENAAASDAAKKNSDADNQRDSRNRSGTDTVGLAPSWSK